MSLNKLAAILSGVVLMAGCANKMYIIDNLDTAGSDIDTISIILPHVEYYVKGRNANETKLGHSIFVSRYIADNLNEVIDSGNFISKHAIANYDSIVIQEWLPRYFSSSVMKYKLICDSLRSVRSDNILFPLTSELKLLVDKVKTRYFMFIAGTAYDASDDKKNYDFEQERTFKLLYDRSDVYQYQWYGLQLHMFIVEKKSGKIAWYSYNKNDRTKYNPTKKEDIKDLCMELLKRK